MDSRPSDAPARLVRLRDAIRGGNWGDADAISRELERCALPQGSALGEYLETLRETLTLARAARSNAAASLARIRAAVRFQESLTGSLRQDFAGAANTGPESLVSSAVPSDI
jgi:hypothetical protein